MRLERPMKRILLSTLALAPALLLAALLVPATVAAAGPDHHGVLVHRHGHRDLRPVGRGPARSRCPVVSVTVWGFATTTGGTPTVPGPAIVVDQGDAVTVNLTNNLAQPTSLVFDGVAMAPDLTPVAAGRAATPTRSRRARPVPTSTRPASCRARSTRSRWASTGALIVRPTGSRARPGLRATPSTAFARRGARRPQRDRPGAQQQRAPRRAFDLRAFAPKYFLVNGVAYSSAAAIHPGDLGQHPAPALRERGHPAPLDRRPRPAPAGARRRRQPAAGRSDGWSPRPSRPGRRPTSWSRCPRPPRRPPCTRSTTPPWRSTTATAQRHRRHARVPRRGAAPPVAPTPSARSPAASRSCSATGALSAIGQRRDDRRRQRHRRRVLHRHRRRERDRHRHDRRVRDPDRRRHGDDPAPTLAGLSSGSHTVYVRGQDALGNWGALGSTTFAIDTTGPTTSALTLNPNPSNGSVSVALGGTASDAATGNANVTAAEYFIGAPAPTGPASR